MLIKNLLFQVLFMVIAWVVTFNMSLAQEDFPINTISPHTVLDLQYSPDGQYLAQIFASGRLQVTETDTSHAVIDEIVDLPYALLQAQVAWTPIGDRLAAGIGQHVYIWQLDTLQLSNTIIVGGEDQLVYSETGYYLPESVVSLEWDSTGMLLMAKSISSRFTVWSSQQNALIADQFYGNNPVPIVWLSDDRHLSNNFTLFDIQAETFSVLSPQRILTVTNNCSVGGSLVSNSDRSLTAQGTYHGCIVITDPAAGRHIAGYKIAENQAFIQDVSWSPDETMIAAVDMLGSVYVLDLNTGAVAVIAQVEGELYAIDWSSTRNEIAYGGLALDNTAIFETINMNNISQNMNYEVQQPIFAVGTLGAP